MDNEMDNETKLHHGVVQAMLSLAAEYTREKKM